MSAALQRLSIRRDPARLRARDAEGGAEQHLFARRGTHEQLELALVIQQPVEIEEALVDDVLIQRPLVLDDDRSAILIEPQGVDAASVQSTRPVLRREETDRRISRFRSMSV